MSYLENTLSQSAFWIVNKKLVKELSGNHVAALLLADLLTKRAYYRERNMLEADGSFFAISTDIEKDLVISEHVRRKAIVCLQDHNLITMYQKQSIIPDKGIQSVNYIIINDLAIEGLLGGRGQNFTPPPPKNLATVAKNLDPNKNKEIRIKREKEEKIEIHTVSAEDVYKSWLSSVPTKSDYNDCYEELLSLFTTLHSNKLKESEISSSLKKKIMSRWSRSKFPQKQEEAWDRAAGDTWKIEMTTPVPKKYKPKTVGRPGEITLDQAIDMATDDDVLAAIAANMKSLMESEDE